MYKCLLVLMIFGTVTKSTNDVPNETIQQELLSMRGVLENIVSKLEKSEIRNDLLTHRLEMTEQTNMDLKERLAAAENRIRILGNCNQGVNKRFSNYSPTEVAFSTRLTKHLTGLRVHQTIPFDKVVTDTSSAYDHQSGVFTAPLAGMYVFTWTTAVAQYESTELTIGGTVYGYAHADVANDGDLDYGSASQTVVVEVHKNQRVWIRTTGGSGTIDGNNDNTFSGWLLYSLE